MKITWNGRDVTGRFSLTATPESYDGVPAIDRVYIDRDMLILNNDVLGIASVLMFGSYCEGGLTLPKEVSPEAAASIEEFLSPANVRVANVQYEPFGISAGAGSVYMNFVHDIELPVANMLGKHRVSRCTILDAAQYSGAITSMEGVTLASNALLVGKLSSSIDFLPALGVTLLFAESLRARTIILDDDLLEFDGLRARLSSLLVGCKMTIVSTSELNSLNMISSS